MDGGCEKERLGSFERTNEKGVLVVFYRIGRKEKRRDEERTRRDETRDAGGAVRERRHASGQDSPRPLGVSSAGGARKRKMRCFESTESSVEVCMFWD